MRSTYRGYLEAGLKIEEAFESYCTSNIQVKKNLSDYYLLTAGHCVNDGSTYWWQGDHYIGYGAMWNSGDADVGAIAIDGSDVSSYIYITSTQDREIESYQLSTQDNVGDFICQAGATTGYSCGTIESTDIYGCWDGNCFDKQRLANYDIEPGDSGAPVFLLSEIIRY